MVIALKLARRDAMSHALLRGTLPVGWIRAGVIGLDGLADRAEARRAADVAARVLADWYAARRSTEPAPWTGTVGPDDRIAVLGAVAGRIVAPVAAAREGGGESFAIEIGVPPETWLAVQVQLAQQLYGALTDEGLTRDAVPAGATA